LKILTIVTFPGRLTVWSTLSHNYRLCWPSKPYPKSAHLYF